ncbi:MAG: hypothetical protein JXA82_09145 [Sedimentisphaerales bacterium]|nr:hypothetical protein [Sedimentisphaerales bacterium]
MKRTMLFMLSICLASLAQAASVRFQSEAPTVGANDVAHLGESTTDAGNVEGVEGDFYGPDQSTYIAHDRPGMGQTFTTGSDPDGYFMQGFWLKHVSYVTDQMSWWNTLTADAPLIIRVTDPSQEGAAGFELSVETYTTTGAEPGAFGSGSGAGTGIWVYFELDTPIHLSPDTLYGFDVTVTNSVAWFFETAGLDGAASYAGGDAYQTGTGAGTNSLNMETIWDGDHTFLVDMIDGLAYVAPLNGATAVLVDQDISWTIIDSDITTVDVYFGTEDDPNLTLKPVYKKLSKEPATTTSYDPGTLDFSTTYYWRIDAYEPNDVPGGDDILIPGPVWSFTTVPASPIFTENPELSAVFPNEAAVFTATCSSLSALEGSIQWFKVGSPDVEITTDDPDVSIVENTVETLTTSTLTIYNITDVREGDYYAKATNAGGESSSGTGSIIIKKLLAYYPFNGDPGDASGNGLDGTPMTLGVTPNDVLPAYVEGKVGQAVSLSDTYDNYIELPEGFADFRSGITLNLWAYPMIAGNWANFIQFSNGAPGDNIFFCRSGTSTTLQFRTANGEAQNTALNALVAIELNSWQMFTVTLDASGVAKVYKNGLRCTYYNANGSINTPQVTMPIPNVVPRINNFIGKSAWNDAYFTGQIDEVRIYNYALTDDEIVTRYLADAETPLCRYKPEYDFTGDCIVNMEDFAAFAAQWLQCGLDPSSACD